MDNRTINRSIIEWKDGVYAKDEVICNEYRLNIYINDDFYISLMCLPDKLEELLTGFLFFEGVINVYEDIIEIRTEQDKVYVRLIDGVLLHKEKKRILTTGCGRALTCVDMEKPSPCKHIDTRMRISAAAIQKRMKEFSTQSDLFLKTGGVHACTIVDENGCVVFAEDIGRHNAVDKCIGHCLMNNIDFAGKMLLTTGRISSEMIAKAVKSKIPVVVSRSAPTSYGVSLAEHFFITLIGFARADRFNVYTYPERIIKEE